MGTRYLLTLKCPRCNITEPDIYYAPTCGFTTWTCANCELVIDLEAYTGISYEDASNTDEIEQIIEEFSDEEEPKYHY